MKRDDNIIKHFQKSIRRTCQNENCRQEYLGLKRKCDKCGGEVANQPTQYHKVTEENFGNLFENLDIGQKNCEVEPTVSMGEPILATPIATKM